MTWYGTDSARDYSIFVQKFNADGTIALPPAISAAGNATVQSSETGTAYLVSSAITVNTLADITAAADSSWNSVTITTANSTTNLAATGLADGTYKVYTIDAAGNLSAAATNTITVDGVPTQTVGTDRHQCRRLPHQHRRPDHHRHPLRRPG